MTPRAYMKAERGRSSKTSKDMSPWRIQASWNFWRSVPLLSLWLSPYLWWPAALLLLTISSPRSTWNTKVIHILWLFPLHTNRCLCLGFFQYDWFFQYDCHLCFVRHLYVLKPSSAETFLIWSSPLGKTTYFPSGGGRRLDQALRFDIYVDVAEDCLVLVT